MPITPGRVAWYVTGRFYLESSRASCRIWATSSIWRGSGGLLFNDDAIGEAHRPPHLPLRPPFDAQTGRQRQYLDRPRRAGGISAST